MKAFLTLTASAFLLASSQLVAQTIVISDPVQNADGWTNINGGFFTASIGGLTPIEGDRLWAAANSTANRGIWKYFSETFTEATYEASYYIGDRPDLAFSSGTVASFLLADTNTDGIYEFDERIIATAQDRVIPDAGFENWKDTYNISATTQNVRGDNVLGSSIGFVVFANIGNPGNLAFDSLDISTTVIPEPSEYGVFVGALALGIFALKRRKR